MIIYEHTSAVKNCILELLVGDVLGEGASRAVYALPSDPTLVLKVEHSGRTFHNPTEWLIWEEVRGWPISDWFAPCLSIDSWGTSMTQRRTIPFESEEDFKLALKNTRGGRIPSVFSDTHYHNFGMLNGSVTCHDYGYHKMLEGGARAMCEELGYINIDPPPPAVKTHRKRRNTQLELDL